MGLLECLLVTQDFGEATHNGVLGYPRIASRGGHLGVAFFAWSPLPAGDIEGESFAKTLCDRMHSNYPWVLDMADRPYTAS